MLLICFAPTKIHKMRVQVNQLLVLTKNLQNLKMRKRPLRRIHACKINFSRSRLTHQAFRGAQRVP